ncbi:hypothetical protein [Streptomyces parvulus]|uniref:hypothetical protein n=1 Tax=Streptomyces parvulus TaxID=146923 RepID=UPI00371409A2
MQTSTSRRRVARSIAVLGAVAIVAGTAVTSVAADDHAATRSGQTATPAAYISYLASSSEEGAAQTLSDFKGLPAAEQEKYLDYLNNPEVFRALMEDAPEPTQDTTAGPQSAPAEDTTTSLFGGDVVVESEHESTFTPDTKPEPGSSAEAARKRKLSRGTWESTYSHTQKIFGVTVTKLSVWVNYYTNGSKITKVNFADGGRRNYNASVSISKGVPKHWKDGRYANGSVVWEGNIVFKGFGVSIDKREKVWANEYGYRGGYLKNI